jgi:hypothetical protein
MTILMCQRLYLVNTKTYEKQTYLLETLAYLERPMWECWVHRGARGSLTSGELA